MVMTALLSGRTTMGMLRTALAIAILAVTLAACGTDPVEPPPTPTSTTPSAPTTTDSTTGTPTPTPPVMPEAAKAHTADGAKAFVVYYWQVVDYAQQTLDVTTLRALALPTCVGCRGGVKAIATIAKENGRLVGGSDSVAVSSISSFNAGEPAVLDVKVTTTSQDVLTPGKPTVHHPAGTSHMVMTLVPRDNSWIVSDLRER
jgi:hypothetical protein